MSDDIWVPGQNEAEVTLVNAFIPTAPVVVELLSIEAPMSPEGELVIDSSFNLTSSTTQLSVTAYDWDSYDCLADAPRANAGNLTIMLNTSQIQGTLLDASAQKVQYNYSVPDNPPNGSDLQLYYVAPALRISKGWTCATGYTGEACAMCCEGDEEDPSCPGAYYRLNGVCMVCPEGNSGFMIGAMIVIGLFAPAIFAATDKMPALPSLDIGLTFAQVTATFPGRDLNWPASVKRVMDACSVFSFNVEMVHPECNLK
eukprot:gene8743-10364_t